MCAVLRVSYKEEIGGARVGACCPTCSARGTVVGCLSGQMLTVSRKRNTNVAVRMAGKTPA